MFERIAQWSALQGRDAAHRARNLDTHLTHVCIPLFRHFSRVRQEYAPSADRQTVAFARHSASAPRILGVAAL